jgi:hypothetical protein
VRQPRRPTSPDCQPPRRYADDRCRESAAGAGGGQVLGFQAFSHRDVAVGADAETQVLALPREHPLLGLRKCAVVDCQAGVRTPNTDLRKLCVERFKVSGIPIETFTAAQCGKSAKGEQWCRIRAVSGSRICGYGCVTTTTASGVVSRSRNSLRCRHVSVSAVAVRAKVHRSFIHRHPDLHAAVPSLRLGEPPDGLVGVGLAQKWGNHPMPGARERRMMDGRPVTTKETCTKPWTPPARGPRCGDTAHEGEER